LRFVYDTKKAQSNLETKDVNFADADKFEWNKALITEDARREYSEVRKLAYGKLAGRLTVMVYTERADVIRIISWRKANKREVAMYEKVQD